MGNFFKDLWQDPVSMIFAVVVHLLVAGLLFFSLEWSDTPTPPQSSVEVVQAVAIDEKKLQAEVNKLRQAEERRKKEEQDKQRKLEEDAAEAKRQREAEEQQLAQVKAEQETERKRQQELEVKRKEQERQLAEEREKKQQELDRLQAEKEELAKKRAAEEKALAAAETKRKQEEEERSAREAAEQKRQADIERKQKEAVAKLQAQIAAEQELERKRLESLKGRYIADIQNKVQQHWRKPITATAGQQCKVDVKQIPGGEVINVAVTQCTGDDFFRRSVEQAVLEASPLPLPGDPSLFDRELVFTFKPR